VALLDIDMPGLSSFEAARTIGIHSPATRIIFLSAFVRDHYVEQAVEVKASGYLTKTQSPEAVADAIRLVASGSTCYAPEVQMRIVLDNDCPRLDRSERSLLSGLTSRELEVLRQIAAGHSKKEIAGLLHLSEKTVETHSQRVMDKLDIHDRVGLARFAIREGLSQL
jgi:DNA-binding NarL/FixJ family response regulator